MPPPATSSVRLLFSILMVAIAYSSSLWRIIKGNRGNRVVECGSMALIVALLMVILIGFPKLPDWVQPSLGLLFLLMSLLTIFFVLLRALSQDQVGNFATPELMAIVPFFENITVNSKHCRTLTNLQQVADHFAGATPV